MKLLLTLSFISILILRCHGQDHNNSSKYSNQCREFYNALKQQFTIIDSLRQMAYDSLEKANDKLINIISQFRTDIFDFQDSLDYDLIYLVKSSDKKLALISWDTRTGGTMIDFTTIAIYKSAKEIKIKMLLDTTDENMPDTYMHFNSINTITSSSGRKIYLAWGNGQGSTMIPWQELRAFSINNEKLVEPKIFLNSMSKISVDFDLHFFKENQKVPTIKIRGKGTFLEVPVADKKQGFSGKYTSYYFNGKVFKIK